MNEIINNKIFNGHPVRVQVKDGNIFFCLSDVGKVLNLSNVYRNVKKLGKGSHRVTIPTNGGRQDFVFIDEPTLYRVIFMSKKDEAVKFQDWVFEDVLPSIRKTGKYFVPDKLKKMSTEKRNALTDAWEESGITKRHHFIQLTLQEYKALGFEKGKRKKDLTREEILLLSALESMEMLNLFYNPKDGYYECRDSLHQTAVLLPQQEKNYLED